MENVNFPCKFNKFKVFFFFSFLSPEKTADRTEWTVCVRSHSQPPDGGVRVESWGPCPLLHPRQGPRAPAPHYRGPCPQTPAIRHEGRRAGKELPPSGRYGLKVRPSRAARPYGPAYCPLTGHLLSWPPGRKFHFWHISSVVNWLMGLEMKGVG